MICPYCKAEIVDDSRFCDQCGMQLENKPTDEHEQLTHDKRDVDSTLEEMDKLLEEAKKHQAETKAKPDAKPKKPRSSGLGGVADDIWG